MNETGNDSLTPFSALAAAERTDRGRVRENNEDVTLCLPAGGLFMVADGMGGAREGEVAARAVAEHVKDACSDPTQPLPARIRCCKEAINASSLWIRQYAARQGNPGMGTTVVMLLFDPFDPGAAVCLHAGDSRLYRFRNGILEQVTRDHSMANLAGVASEGQVPSLFRGVITRAVGVRRNVDLEVTYLDVARGDLFLLCTDGLHGMVERDELTRLLTLGSDLDTKAVHLVEAALSAGGDDNVTVILVRSGAAPETPPGQAPDAARSMPLPGREARARTEFGSPLIGLLMFALLGGLAVWFAFTPWRDSPAPAPAPPAVQAPPVQPDPVPAPPPEPPPVPVVSVIGTNEAVADWDRERGEVAADPELIKARHQVVRTAYYRLGDWSGKPLEPPSLMIAGRAEERPEAWFRYLETAQTQWVAFARTECARLRAEASCLNGAGLAALWRGARGTAADDPAFLELLAAWTEWKTELDRMELYLKDVADPAKPFLYGAQDSPFAPGRSAAEWGDRTWGQVLPLIGDLWKRRNEMAAQKGEAEAAWVDDSIRQANALWAGYVDSGHHVRVWRQRMDPVAAGSFFDRMAAGPERAADNP
jgi:protein phosphatase